MPLECGRIGECLRVFAAAGDTQSGEHIKPFHKYIANRLVIEGGFLPDEITPHPPIRCDIAGGRHRLILDPTAATRSELVVLGGMKTKKIDIVVEKKGVGPVLAVSVKGTSKAYRNLMNRMEEAIGDSTNLHVMYPGLVYGFLHLFRANRGATGTERNDVGITRSGEVAQGIQRYYSALCEMTGRRFVRNDFTRYESVAIVMVESNTDNMGEVYPAWPPADSPLNVGCFFKRIYEVYHLRFPLRADTVKSLNRVEWQRNSPLLEQIEEETGLPIDEVLGYQPRLAG